MTKNLEVVKNYLTFLKFETFIPAALAAQPTNEQSEDSLSVQDSPFEESFENKIDPETEIRNTEKFEDLNEQQLKEEDEYVPVKVINCVSPSEIYVRPMKQVI